VKILKLKRFLESEHPHWTWACQWYVIFIVLGTKRWHLSSVVLGMVQGWR
jgi:hypothetical protein